ncbi:hypothetical protein EYR40_004266 [Pleurotus pulmonarius]|nr:hypothetical protein EYR40_004266 [Pleurotus pulmonarius]
MADELTRLLDKILGSLAEISPCQLAIEDCDQFENKANSAVATIRLLQNMSTPVHKLPAEVLAVIFTEVIRLDVPQDFLPDIVSLASLESGSRYGIEGLSRVCRKWRDAAFAFPALWSIVYFIPPHEDVETTVASDSLAARLLQVPKSASLKVFAITQHEDSILLPDLPRESESMRFFRLIASRAACIEELHIINFDNDALKDTSFLSTSLPNLQALTLWMDPRGQWYDDPWIPDALFSGGTPRLRKLTIRYCPCVFVQTLAGLTHLCLADTRYSPQFTLDRLLDLLRACPQLEDLTLADCCIDSTPPNTTNTIVLPDLRALCLGNWQSESPPIDIFLSYLIISQPIHFFMWGVLEDGAGVMTGLADIIPSYIKEEARLKELRITRYQDPSHTRHVDWRTGLCNAIISTPDTLQVDGKFLSPSFLLDAPVMMDLGGVQELWLGSLCHNEPSIAEWRTFFSAFPSLVTLVISRRPFLRIITALTLPKETPDAPFLVPHLSTLRIYGNKLPSALPLFIFAEQRDRRNHRLTLLEIICVHGNPPPLPGWGNGSQQVPQGFDNGSDDLGDGHGGIGNRGFRLKVLNQTMVVLSSPRAIKDVLDKNGISTSDRFQPYTLLHAEGIYQIFDLASKSISPDFDLNSIGHYMLRIKRGKGSHRWKAMRKATHTLLAPEALRGYWAFQQTEYLRLLHDVLESPKDIFTHIKRTTASIMTTLIYGKSIPHYAGSKAELFFEGTKCINELVAPFDHPPLDFFPILRHVPERWAPWKTLSKKTKQIRDAFDQDLFLQCEEAVQSGKRPVCFVENVLDTKVELGVSRDEARAMGRVLLDAGTETSASFLHSFVMAMTCYPEVQSKAQDEIDRVLRSDQLPLPITPAGIPHAASHDTQYNGFVIPEGSIIFMNIWGVFHDPELFDDPESFNPERYILSEFGTKVGADTEGFRDSLPFGAGRRICPGMDMASRNIAMNAINLLWAFRFSKDTLGICSMDLENYLPGLELALKPFTCNIEVRGEARARLIREAYDAAAM